VTGPRGGRSPSFVIDSGMHHQFALVGFDEFALADK